MACISNITLLVRSIIGDNVVPYTYTNAQLSTMIVHAAYMIYSNVSFGTAYTIDIDDETIVPDAESDFVSLIVLKVVCMLLNNEYRIASNKAISVKDGPSSIDARGVTEAKKLLAENACEQYTKAELMYNANNYAAFKAIVGPFNWEGGYSSDNTERFR